MHKFKCHQEKLAFTKQTNTVFHALHAKFYTEYPCSLLMFGMGGGGSELPQD